MSLRPRTGPELVDAAVSLARSTYGRLITLATLSYLPIALVRVIGLRPSEEATVTPVDAFLTVYDLVWQSLGWAAILVVLSQHYLGGRGDLASAVRAVSGDGWRITILSVGASLLTLIGLVLFIVPGVYFMVRFFAIPQTLLFERTTIRDALVRSLWLSRQDQRRLAIASVATLAISLATWWALGAGISPLLPAQWHADLIAGAVQLFLEPFLAAIWLLFYYDVRIRIEGFDVKQELENTAG